MACEATILHYTFFFFYEISSFQLEVRQCISPKGASEIDNDFSANMV